MPPRYGTDTKDIEVLMSITTAARGSSTLIRRMRVVEPLGNSQDVMSCQYMFPDSKWLHHGIPPYLAHHTTVFPLGGCSWSPHACTMCIAALMFPILGKCLVFAQYDQPSSCGLCHMQSIGNKAAEHIFATSQVLRTVYKGPSSQW